MQILATYGRTTLKPNPTGKKSWWQERRSQVTISHFTLGCHSPAGGGEFPGFGGSRGKIQPSQDNVLMSCGSNVSNIMQQCADFWAKLYGLIIIGRRVLPKSQSVTPPTCWHHFCMLSAYNITLPHSQKVLLPLVPTQWSNQATLISPLMLFSRFACFFKAAWCAKNSWALQLHTGLARPILFTHTNIKYAITNMKYVMFSNHLGRSGLVLNIVVNNN